MTSLASAWPAGGAEKALSLSGRSPLCHVAARTAGMADGVDP